MDYSPSPRSAQVAGEVRAEMAKQRITASFLAEAIGMSPATLSRRLSGAMPFDVDELHDVGRVLGVTATELLARAEVAAA